MPRKKTVPHKVTRRLASSVKSKTKVAKPTSATGGIQVVSAIVRGMAHKDPFPLRYKTKLMYGDVFNMVINNVGTASEQIFRLNSLFDPDFTNIGHQPLYRDQLSALYNRYIVNSCTVNLSFTDPSKDGLAVYIAYGYNPTSGTSMVSLLERPMCKVYMINNTGQQAITYGETISCAKVLHITKKAYTNSYLDTGNTNGSDPGQVAYLRFGALNVNNTEPAATINVIVSLTYNCTFFERNVPATS